MIEVGKTPNSDLLCEQKAPVVLEVVYVTA